MDNIMKSAEPLMIVEQNTEGRDFVVGDIHGEYEKLMKGLDDLGFDKTKDRLFSVGDLVDRGPRSLDVLKLIKEPWFFAVVGNHEDMMFEVVLGDSYSGERSWYMNGGEWGMKVNQDELKEITQYAYENLPLAIQINRPEGNIGVIHASPPVEWSAENIAYKCMRVMWDRTFLYSFKSDPKKVNVPHLPEIVKLYMGHTPSDQPYVFWDGMYNWIDTGACFGGKLTILEI
jgi:serine/threonine protein phosphatase 1